MDFMIKNVFVYLHTHARKQPSKLIMMMVRAASWMHLEHYEMVNLIDYDFESNEINEIRFDFQQHNRIHTSFNRWLCNWIHKIYQLCAANRFSEWIDYNDNNDVIVQSQI